MSNISYVVADEVLSRCGIKREFDHVLISNTALWVKKALDGTQWAKNHSRILIRIEGAKNVESIRFAGGIRGRAISIPLNVVYLP